MQDENSSAYSIVLFSTLYFVKYARQNTLKNYTYLPSATKNNNEPLMII